MIVSLEVVRTGDRRKLVFRKILNCSLEDYPPGVQNDHSYPAVTVAGASLMIMLPSLSTSAW